MKRKKKKHLPPPRFWPEGLASSPQPSGQPSAVSPRHPPPPLCFGLSGHLSLSGPSSPSPFFPPPAPHGQPFPFPLRQPSTSSQPSSLARSQPISSPPFLSPWAKTPRGPQTRRPVGQPALRLPLSPGPRWHVGPTSSLTATGPHPPVPLSPSSRRGRPGVSVCGNHAVNPGFCGIWVNPVTYKGLGLVYAFDFPS